VVIPGSRWRIGKLRLASHCASSASKAM